MAILSARGQGGSGNDKDTNGGGGGTGGGVVGNSEATKEFLRAAGQSGKSSAGGSQVLASGGDPVSASMSVRPGATQPQLDTANRLLTSAFRTSPEPKQVLGNVKTVFGGNGESRDPTGPGPGQGDVPQPRPQPDVPAPDLSGIGGALSGLQGQLAAIMGELGGDGGGPGLGLIAVGAVALFALLRGGSTGGS